MALPSELFLAMFPIQETIINKDDGTLLANGYVEFYSDQAFTVPKNVYKQTYSPGTDTYSYVSLGPILTLDSIGSFQDNDGNQIIPFLYPYDDDGNVQLYFIRVYSADGILQFTRDGWPPNFTGDISPVDSFESTVNEITNPQFSDVIFSPDPTTDSVVYTVSGANTVTPIAQGWSLVTSGSGTVTVKQVAISDTGVESNPPYAIDITSTGITNIKLRQQLEESPRLLYGSFVNGNFMAQGQGATPAVTMSMHYVPSNGTQHTIISDTTTPATGEWKKFNDTAQIIGGTINPDTAPTGYVNIEIVFEPLKQVQITSVQLLGVQNSDSSAQFQEQSIAIQENNLFWYYNPKLQYKPIPSLLTAWDFPLNPAQTGSTQTISADATAGAVGVNWDQTLSARAGANVAMIRSATTGGAQFTTSSADDAFYLLQYLTRVQAKKILGTRLSVNINAYKGTVGTSATCRVYLFRATTAATLPTAGTGIGTMNTAGVFTLTQAGWTEIPRSSQGVAIANLKTVTNANDINSGVDYGFSGWEITDSGEIADTDKFAIIVTFAAPTSATVITVNSISVTPGDIPTRPAPQTKDEVLRECQYYYEQSYAAVGATNPAGSATAVNIRTAQQGAVNSGGNNVFFPRQFQIIYTVQKRTAPTLSIFSEAGTASNVTSILFNNGGAQASGDLALTSWSAGSAGLKSIYYNANNITGTLSIASSNDRPEGFIHYHFVADSRLGVV